MRILSALIIVGMNLGAIQTYAADEATAQATARAAAAERQRLADAANRGRGALPVSGDNDGDDDPAAAPADKSVGGCKDGTCPRTDGPLAKAAGPIEKVVERIKYVEVERPAVAVNPAPPPALIPEQGFGGIFAIMMMLMNFLGKDRDRGGGYLARYPGMHMFGGRYAGGLGNPIAVPRYNTYSSLPSILPATYGGGAAFGGVGVGNRLIGNQAMLSGGALPPSRIQL